MKINVIFAWFDFWVGIFFDRAKRRVYIFPVPMFGVVIQLPVPPPPPVIRRGDVVRINQPGFAFDGYIGTVTDCPDENGFTLSDGNSVVICPEGDFKRAIHRRRSYYGLPAIKTTYTVLEHGNEF